jgi:hypothetical protein
MYEPYLFGFSERLVMALPAWGPAREIPDNWRTSAWERVSSSANPPAVVNVEDDDHS